MIDELVAHARAEAPNECCGMIASSGGEAVRVYPVTNAEASSLRFVMDEREQYLAMQEIDDDGKEVGAIYHSHTRSEPRPSETDILHARTWWPDPLWVIVGLTSEQPEIRAWSINRQGEVSEVPLDVV